MSKLMQRDKRKIYISNLLGYRLNGTPIYSHIIETECQIALNKKGKVVQETNGVTTQYDIVCLLEYNHINKYINELTRFWINTAPIKDNYNYKVVKSSQVESNIMTIYLKSVEQNWDSVYTYSEENGIYEIQCYFDETNSKLRIPKNSFFNISIQTKIWSEIPSDENDTNNLYQLLEKIEEEDFIVYKLKKVSND